MVTLRIKFGSDSSVKAVEMRSNDEDAALTASSEQSKKRGASELEEVQAKKKLKLDRRSSSQCLTLLRLLRDHKFGGLFKEPVDPVKLKIPDYFEIITKPMDLGTIKSKLLRNVYCSTDEFAADVRLTFSNAMLYNPPDNMVHQMAKVLKEVFEDRWESLTKKKVSKFCDEETDDSYRQPDCSRQSSPGTSASSGRSSVKVKKPVKEKVSPLLKPVKAQSQNNTSLDTSSTTKLRIKKLEPGLGVGLTVKIPSKGLAPTAACGSCGRVTCICLKSCNSSGSEVSSLTDCQIMNTPGANANDSDPLSNGSVNSGNEKNGCVSSQIATEVKKTFTPMPPLPPEKALRAAILKSQFAETILKAKHRKVLDQSNKADLMRIRVEKEQMERTQRQEKARIEAEIREAKNAALMRAETELRQQQARERQYLETLEKTCGLEEYCFERYNQDLIYLCGSSNLTRSRLLELGLFLRNHYCPKMELELSGGVKIDDVEEGEIL